MFGGFQNGWPAGFTQFSDLSDRALNLRKTVEAGLQDSGLLGPGEAPSHPSEEATVGNRHEETNDHAAERPQEGQSSQALTPADDATGASDLHSGSAGQSWDPQPPAPTPEADQRPLEVDEEASGWDEPELDLTAPGEEEAAAPDSTELEPGEAGAHEGVAYESEAPTAAPDPGDPPSSSVPAVEAAEASELAPRKESEEETSTEEAAESGTVEEEVEAEPSAVNRRRAVEEGTAVEERELEGVAHSVTASEDEDEVQEATARQDESSQSPPSSPKLNNSKSLPNELELGKPNGFSHAQTATAPPPDPASPADDGPSEAEAEARWEEMVGAMTQEELRACALELKRTLRAREVQLERKFEEVVNMQEVTHQLMGRNEELARKAAKTSEEDIKTLTDEYEARLGAAERKVYALTKERDMLKRGQEKLTSATDLVKEKDSIIAQVMAEGEQLSKKQLAQESTMKKLRQHVKDAELSRNELAADLAVERQRLEAATAARQKAEGELAAAKSAHRQELEAERAHYNGLLSKSRAAQVEAENRAAASAKEGLARKLKDAETRVEMVSEQLTDLQMSMERQRAAADSREDMLKREVAEMERRNQEAEARHEELTGKLPEATRPLLRQIEGMQRTAAAHSQAWQAAEQSLNARLSEAESAAASSAEKERLATERLQAATRRASSLSAALDALREECSEVQAQCSGKEEEARTLLQQCKKLEEQVAKLQSRLASVEGEKAELEGNMHARLEQERQAGLQALDAAERRAAALEQRLRQQASTESGPPSNPAAGEPPAMAGPGYKWVLQREGQEASASPCQQAGPSGRDWDRWGGPRGMGRATPPELERLHSALQQKEEQLASYQETISELEATRDSLSEALVVSSQTAEQHASAWRDLERARQECAQVQQKLAACTELLGEREERILELTADVADMKALYREQIEFVLGELNISRSPSAAASSVSSWNPGQDK